MSSEEENSIKSEKSEDVEEPKEQEESTEKESEEGKQEITLQQMEQLEEAKLKARYPSAVRPGGSAFLQKRLNKGQKYFDSGDYNMAKAKCNKSRVQILQQPTGEAIPTPDNLPTRKTSLVQSKLAAGLT